MKGSEIMLKKLFNLLWKTKTKVIPIIKEEIDCCCCNCVEYDAGENGAKGYCPLIYWRYDLALKMDDHWFCREIKIKQKWQHKYFIDVHSRPKEDGIIYKIENAGVKRSPGMISDVPYEG
jgi:hypothetical protein